MGRSARAAAAAVAAADNERTTHTALRSLKPTVVMPTPASATSSASTAALDSSDSNDTSDDERGAFLSHSSPPRRSRTHRSKSKAKRSPSGGSNRSSHQPAQEHKPRHDTVDLERGGAAREGVAAAAIHEWQVTHEFHAPCGSSAVLQLVQLKRANFGVRWRGAGAPTCLVGPHWWLMGCTFTVFLGVALVVTVLTAPSAGAGEAAMGVLLSTACLSMYAMVGCANPGIVERIDDPPDDTYSYCDQCDSYRPEGYVGYDHHCPWTGKCIGRGNVRYFYAWLFFLVLAFVYEVIEFTTYILPPEDQPAGPTFFDDDDGGAALAAAKRVVIGGGS
ncbi:hypothetical protein PybrP1_010186 [[Pythium] brassicae (nom. inval.)]|nr:hypothetical protein PybrP1_010186 [[Pythium] brassicae (nom. inval.)]